MSGVWVVGALAGGEGGGLGGGGLVAAVGWEWSSAAGIMAELAKNGGFIIEFQLVRVKARQPK